MKLLVRAAIQLSRYGMLLMACVRQMRLRTLFSKLYSASFWRCLKRGKKSIQLNHWLFWFKHLPICLWQNNSLPISIKCKYFSDVIYVLIEFQINWLKMCISIDKNNSKVNSHY